MTEHDTCSLMCTCPATGPGSRLDTAIRRDDAGRDRHQTAPSGLTPDHPPSQCPTGDITVEQPGRPATLARPDPPARSAGVVRAAQEPARWIRAELPGEDKSEAPGHCECAPERSRAARKRGVQQRRHPEGDRRRARPGGRQRAPALPHRPIRPPGVGRPSPPEARSGGCWLPWRGRRHDQRRLREHVAQGRSEGRGRVDRDERARALNTTAPISAAACTRCGRIMRNSQN